MEKIKRYLIIGSITLFIVILVVIRSKYFDVKERILGSQHEKEYQLMEESPINPLSIEQTINLGNQRKLAHVYHISQSISGLAIVDYDNRFLEWLPEGEPRIKDSYFRVPGEYMNWFRFDNLTENYGVRELLVQYANGGTSGVHPFYLYFYDGEDFELILKLVEAYSKIEIRDLDADWPDEIVHSYSLSGIGKLERDLLRWKDIWRLEEGTPVKVNHEFSKEYEDLIDLYNLALNKKEWEPDAKSYYPTIRCLKTKAEVTVQGELTSTEECQDLLRKRYNAHD